MFDGIFNLIKQIVFSFVNGIMDIFNSVLINVDFGSWGSLDEPLNISLFSDNVILSSTVGEILTLTVTIIFIVITIRFLIKATKKFINVVFGVFRV